MRARGDILLVSCYELGHQPLSLASPLAVLRAAGYDPVAMDTSVQELGDATIRLAELVCISVPMHTALRLGARVAERVRTTNPAARICFYGLYAGLNADYLLREHADYIVAGEYEQALVALADALAAGDEHTLEGVYTREHRAAPVLRRLPFVVPARESLPAPRHYAHLVRGSEVVPAGYVEASRGCLHTCAHCPITPVYGGRFFIVPRDVVLRDIRAQVAQGARHITFGDPDFLNGPGHSLAIVRTLHAEYPDVTWDATIKVEHILERQALFAELAELGCVFVVSAVESVSASVLRHLQKGHAPADVVEALRILDDAGIAMQPTLVAFTPWTTTRDYLDLLHFVEEHSLQAQVAPVQYSIRLLVPPGSALLASDDTADWLGELDEASFTYRWRHPDHRMDALQREMAELVEAATAAGQEHTATFAAVRALAEERLRQRTSPPILLSHGERGGTKRHSRRTSRMALVIDSGEPIGVRLARRPAPHLTEAWFC